MGVYPGGKIGGVRACVSAGEFIAHACPPWPFSAPCRGVWPMGEGLAWVEGENGSTGLSSPFHLISPSRPHFIPYPLHPPPISPSRPSLAVFVAT